MKLNMLKMAALVCCLMTFAACGDDKDEPDVLVNCTYTVTFTPDFFKAAELIIYYKDANNVTKFESVTTEKVKNNTWTKSFTGGKAPANLGVKFVVSPKSETELTQETYNIQVEATIAASVTGGATYTNKSTIASYADLKKDKVVNAMRQINGKDFGYRVDRNGNFTPASHDYSL